MKKPIVVDIAVGDRVCYRKAFLKSICDYTDCAHAKGTVVALEPVVQDFVLAVVKWETGEERPGSAAGHFSGAGTYAKVNVQNLAKVGTLAANEDV